MLSSKVCFFYRVRSAEVLLQARAWATQFLSVVDLNDAPYHGSRSSAVHGWHLADCFIVFEYPSSMFSLLFSSLRTNSSCLFLLPPFTAFLCLDLVCGDICFSAVAATYVEPDTGLSGIVGGCGKPPAHRSSPWRGSRLTLICTFVFVSPPSPALHT